ncbi:glutathione S-transferase family protein [Tropicibacter sp. R15_0]|uniref:glutathione S-transferase family protein n=1 Tax=Tropicibacter sp. R15_0 TaxID=2821101 RepID=UPI001AD96792|nr:glutathione S-transferase family protein [Tropicibacter sp. R15_0]MBO9465822.1 glutathione S-transferase family protein [Tropicibacter sp. R15_0]
MFTLFAAPGSCSRVPLITLEEAGADYRLELVRFMQGAHKQPDYLALNPKGKVPCLVTEAGPITENVAIALFLASQFDGLLPKTSTARAAALVTADLAFCSATLHPIVSRMRVPMFMVEGPEAIGSVKAKAMEAMHPMAAVVETALDGKDWWFGDTWSILDAYIYWVFFRINGGGFPTDQYPNWAAHAKRMDARPAVRRALAKEADMQAALEAEGLAPKMG